MPTLNLRFLIPLLASLVLSACAYAPGMYVGKTGASKDGTTSTWSTWSPWSITQARSSTPAATTGTKSAAGAAGAAAAPDAPPPGSLISITPELLRQQLASRTTDISPEVKQLFSQPKPYRIGASDVLNIVVWDHPELTIAAAGSLATDAGSLSPVGNGYNVSPQGQVQFPYVGALKLSGLTEYEARDLLTQRLSKYLKDPQVTVRIQSYRSGRIYIDGEVRTPGLQSLNDIPMTLPEALGRAGGFTPLADRSSIAITRKGTTTIVNLVRLTERGVSPTSILLDNGDLVRVLAREEAKVFVLGEVFRPQHPNPSQWPPEPERSLGRVRWR